MLEEKQLQAFSRNQHKLYKRQAIMEGVIALLPLFALLGGAVLYSTSPQSGELLSPRSGVWAVVIPLLALAYIVFLAYIVHDIRERLVKK